MLNKNCINKRFDEVFDLKMGRTPNRKEFDFFKGENVWVAIKDFKDKIIFDSSEHISDIAVKESGICLVPKGTVIMSFKLTVGKTAIAGRDLYTNEAIMAFHVKPEYDIDSNFLYYYLQGYKWEGANKAVMGMTLNKATISRQMTNIPNIERQLEIVAELDSINESITMLQQQTKDLDALAQSIFFDMFGDTDENTHGYHRKKMGELCTIERGGSPRPIKEYITTDENGLNWIKIGDATEGNMYISSTKEKIKQEGLRKTRFVHKGDFILSNSMSFGHPYILNIDGCIHDGWLVIHDENNSFDKIYLYYFLSSKKTYSIFSKMAVGGVVNNLNSNMVRNLPIIVPPLSLQKAFASKVAALEDAKAVLNKQIAEMQTLLSARMQYWFG